MSERVFDDSSAQGQDDYRQAADAALRLQSMTMGGNMAGFNVGAFQQQMSPFASGNFKPEALSTGDETRLLDRMGYRMGIAYLVGITLGGAFGAVEGIREARGGSFKLLANRLLTAMGRRGSKLGNALAVLSMFYSATSSTIYQFRKTEDSISTVSSAVAAGALYKSMSGVKGLGLGVATAAGASGAYVACREAGMLKYLPGQLGVFMS